MSLLSDYRQELENVLRDPVSYLWMALVISLPGNDPLWVLACWAVAGILGATLILTLDRQDTHSRKN